MLVQPKTTKPGPEKYPAFPDSIPTGTLEAGRYCLRFARSEQDLDEILRLRFDVFNRELNEGLDRSWRTQRDRDQFDDHCHHMMVQEAGASQIIGTYRLQTGLMAEAGAGFYSAGEYELENLPPTIRSNSIELGRACIDQNFRKRQVLFLLWRGLAAYMLHNRARYFFGCCSLTSQDPAAGWQLYRQLEATGMVRSDVQVLPRPQLRCEDSGWSGDPIPVPTLFSTYLRYQTRVISPPALDREFKTIDYLVLFDYETLDPRGRMLFYGQE
jgi:putative hemolysin